jgi:pimeloyl-ACP methyl ester carboxylesterase
VSLPLPQLDGVTHREVRVNGVRLHVAEAGEGPAVVLLHGWPQHWWAWRKVIPALAVDHRVISPDLRGFGWSDAPPGDYDKESLAADILALLEQLDLGSVELIGHDWGGFVGFLVCLRAPDRVRHYLALNMVHPWFRPPKPSLSALVRVGYQYRLAAPVIGVATLRHRPGFIKRIIRRASHPQTSWTDGELEQYAEPFRSADHARASSALYRTFLTKELRPIAAGRYGDQQLTVPTLILTGDADPLITPERLGGYEQNAADLSVEVVAGAGHFPAEEQPDAVVRRAREFFAKSTAEG